MNGRIGTGLLLLAFACSKGEKAPSTPAATPAAVPVTPAGGGVVTGEVKFVGTAPANPPIDMSEEPKCKAEYTTAPREQVVVVNPNGTLADVFVYVKSGLPVVGQPLEIRNSDALLHNIKAMAKANRPFNISQPAAGMTTTRSFAAPEVMLPFECNVHGWMHAFAGVLPHPFFSATGPAGTFTITGLPPGTYTIEAWHAKYGTQQATVTVQGTETKTVDFTYTAK